LVRRTSEYDYEVRHRSMNGDSYIINLLRKECSCKKWLLTCLPCCHAISCMKAQDIDVNQYVPDCFRKERYEAYYSHIIYPVNGQSLWRRTEYTDLQPPPIKRQPGRPKKNRRKDVDEKRDEQQLKATTSLPASYHQVMLQLLKCLQHKLLLLNLLLHKYLIIKCLLLHNLLLLNLLLPKCHILLLLQEKYHQVNQQHQPSRGKGHQERRKDHHQLSPKALDFFEIVCLL